MMQIAGTMGQTTINDVTSLGVSRPRYRSYDHMKDAEIVEWCQKGDMGAMEALVTRFKRPIYTLAARLTRNYADSQDVAAAATLRLCQNINKCRSAVTLPAWVNRIVVNTFYDMCRSAKKCPTMSLEALTENTDASSLPIIESKDKSPLTIVSEHEQRDLLRQALSKLPGLHAEILTQFYLEDRSYEEIAEMTNVPIGTVKSRLNRARQALQRKLQVHHTAFFAC
jgi:RNA polymerase sigma-70 factor (ECF subfamily)